MKLASFNLENLFDRPRALNEETWAEGKPILDAYAEFNVILRKETYTAADKKKIVGLLDRLGLKKGDENTYVILRQNRGRLLKRAKGKPVEVVAEGRDDWVGWLDLKRAPVNEIATQNTARVIKAMAPDVLAVIEAEDRTALRRFNDQVLGGGEVAGQPFAHAMLIDGNDERGIDVGLFAGADFPIVSIESHVDDADAVGQRIFSRDCAHYTIRTPGGTRVSILVNHLKSKGYGVQADSNAKRLAQAKRVRAIYDALRGGGINHIAIVGDFNDTPDSAPLAPLLGAGSGLKDVSTHPDYQSDGRPGTFSSGTAANKIDYILLSPGLFQTVKSAGVFRMGVWGGKNGTLFPHFDTIANANQAASDHAAIWAELDI